MTKVQAREVLIEYMRIGTSLRVTAVDVETGTEVVFQAPVKASRAEIKRTAIDKLNYVLRKQKKTSP